MAFASKLSQIRKNRRLTQHELAQRAGIGISQMRRYEKGSSSPTLEVIKKLALTLGVSSDELIFDDNERIAAGKILDKDLLQQFEMVSNLTPHDIDAVKTVLESIIVRNKLERIMPARDKAWEDKTRAVVDEFRATAKNRSEDEIEELINEAVTAVRNEDGQTGGRNLGA